MKAVVVEVLGGGIFSCTLFTHRELDLQGSSWSRRGRRRCGPRRPLPLIGHTRAIARISGGVGVEVVETAGGSR